MHINENKFIIKETGELIINKDFAGLFQREGFLQIDDFLDPGRGRTLRQVDERANVKLVLSGKTFYLKRHEGSSPRSAPLALLGIERTSPGMTEFHNIALLEENGFPVMNVAASGEKKSSGLYGESFIMTEEIEGALPLDDYLKQEFSGVLDKEKLRRKRKIIRKLGEVIRQFHRLGFNHRDLYLCHIYVREEAKKVILYIIDLQRMQARNILRGRWIAKDIAQLHYSSLFEGITDRDRMRFLRSYFGDCIIGGAEKKFIKKAVAKTKWMSIKIEKRKERTEKKSK